MSDMKHYNRAIQDWDGQVRFTYEGLQIAVLCQMRDELKRLNSLLHCHNALEIPALLRAIKRNTAKKKRRKK